MLIPLHPGCLQRETHGENNGHPELNKEHITCSKWKQTRSSLCSWTLTLRSSTLDTEMPRSQGRSERPLVLMLTQRLSLYNVHRDFHIGEVPRDKNMGERVQHQARTSGIRPGQSPFSSVSWPSLPEETQPAFPPTGGLSQMSLQVLVPGASGFQGESHRAGGASPGLCIQCDTPHVPTHTSSQTTLLLG